MSDDEIYKEFAAAYEYNDNMANQITTDNKYSYDSTGAYVNILNFDDGQIGYVEIPKIKVSLPIYHGVNEKVLEKGAAHLPNTSFPLDGKSVHSVISAHTAYPAKVFFDNIDKLETGDVFYITILNKKLKYEVCKKNIVDPKDTSLLNIEKDKNLVTLMTCYPYAVNTHRLLVTGELIDIQVKKNSNTISRNETSHNYGLMIFILIVCLKKHTKTLVKVFLAEDNVHYERFLINYAENFSERYVEDYDEYHRALHRLLDKCKCKHLKFVMVKAECAIYSYTEQGDFFLNHKFYVLNNYSVETLLKQKLC